MLWENPYLWMGKSLFVGREIPTLFFQTSLTHIHRTLFPNPSPYSPFDEMGILTYRSLLSRAKRRMTIIEARWIGWRVETTTSMYIGKNTRKTYLWRTDQHAKALKEVCQSESFDSSRRVWKKMKAFFKKIFIFSKKLCQVLHDKFQRYFIKITLNLQYSDVLIKHLKRKRF